MRSPVDAAQSVAGVPTPVQGGAPGSILPQQSAAARAARRPAATHEGDALVLFTPLASSAPENGAPPLIPALTHVGSPDAGTPPPAFQAEVQQAHDPLDVAFHTRNPSQVHAPGTHTASAQSGAREAPAPEPTVHIGNIEIIIEAAAAPLPVRVQASISPNLSSRFYLRGL